MGGCRRKLGSPNERIAFLKDNPIRHDSYVKKGFSFMIYFFLLSDDNTPTTYSGKLFARGLKSAGYPVGIVQRDEKKREILRKIKSGTIIFQKCLHPLHQASSIKHLKGKVRLIHIDDDFAKMDNATHLKTLSMTDLILVVSPIHQKILSSLVKTPSAVVRTITDFLQFPYTPQIQIKNALPIISWQQSHADIYVKDLLEIADPLKEVYQRKPYRLRLFGWHVGKDSPDKRGFVSKALPFAEFIPSAPLKKYFSHIIPQLRQSDVFIVPYRDIPRNWCKGGFALRQIMALGIPVVVSNIGIHPEIIKDGFNGFLAISHEEWITKIQLLIDNPSLGAQFSENARKTVEMEYSEKKCLEIFLKATRNFLL